jgi:hypothetical protein
VYRLGVPSSSVRLAARCAAAVLAFLFAAPVGADAFPESAISNGLITAKLYLPDAKNGYYQGTRFDWSGQIPSLEYKGHTYFGNWNPAPYSPKLHDAIMGPVEEFLTAGAGLGYAEARPGGTFLKIGVGVLRKPQETAYQQFKTYDIVDSGKWSVESKTGSVAFQHVVRDASSGYSYRYSKIVQLIKGKPQMALVHRITNTGTKTIESDVYEHNFYMLDAQPTGPQIVIHFPFDVRAAGDMNGLAETRGKTLVYLKELASGQSAQTELTGFGTDPRDYDIVTENLKTGASVRQTSDRPLTRIHYWSIRSTACPEAYVHIKAAPGDAFEWRILYEFRAGGEAR